MVKLKAMNMKALCITKDRKVLLNEVDVPKIERPNDVLVKVCCAGICKTDLRAIANLIPTKANIPGHEFSGTVVDVGANVNSYMCDVGDYVTANPMKCVDGGMLGIDVDGCFAEYVVVPAQAIRKLDKSIPANVGAFIEPLAAALGASASAVMAAMEHAEFTCNGQQPIGIYGKGRMANLLKFVIGDIWPSKIIDECDKAKSFWCVIETAPTELNSAMKYIEPYGTLILKSRYYKSVDLDINYAVMNNLNLVGVKYGSFSSAIAYAAKNAEQLAKSLEVYNIAYYENAFENAMNEDAKKIILEF